MMCAARLAAVMLLPVAVVSLAFTRVSESQLHLPPNYRPGDGQNQYYLVWPDLKLLFCFIPKVACREFNMMANEFNHLPDITLQSASRWVEMFDGDADRLWSAFNDTDGWTRGVFFRDPMARLVSGFRDKCLPPNVYDPEAAAACVNFPNAAQSPPSIGEFVGKLDENFNEHFALQQSFCGGLRDKIDKFDFVGMVSTDYDQMAHQVDDMLQLARSRLGNPDAVSKTELTTLAYKYFPPAGPDMSIVHNNGTGSEEVKEMFQDPSARLAAEQYYEEDIDWIKSLNLKDH